MKGRTRTGHVNADRRRHLILTAIAILGEGEPTKFAFEAACRHGLRARLSLDGWLWHTANGVAADVVAAALRQVGAQRPTWWQGQPEFTQQGYAPELRGEYRRCGRSTHAITAQGWATQFCSTLCRDATRREKGARTLGEFHAAQRAAGLAKRVERSDNCHTCRRSYIPGRQTKTVRPLRRDVQSAPSQEQILLTALRRPGQIR